MLFDEQLGFDIKDGHLNRCLGNCKHIIIPESVTVVGEHAFFDCNALECVDFPDSVRVLVLGWGDKVFAHCPQLHTIKLGKNIEHYNLSLPAKTKVIFPERFEVFYRNILSAEDTARLLYGLYCRNEEQANYHGFNDVVHVYLTHPSLKVTQKCMSIILNNLEECLAVMRNNLPKLEGKSLHIAKRFLQKYDKQTITIIDTPEQAEQFCRDNYNERSGEKLFEQLNVLKKELLKIRYAKTGQPAPKVVSQFVLTQYMLKGRIERDEICDKIAQLLLLNDLQVALENVYMFLASDSKDNETRLFKEQCFMTAYCRFASSDQIRELKNKLILWETMGEDGKAFAAHVKHALALNDTLTALLFLDKLGQLAYAAKIRHMPLEKLKDSLIPDFGFDQNGIIYGEREGRRHQIILMPDLSLELHDIEKGEPVESWSKELEIIVNTPMVQTKINYNELALTIKEIKENQLAYLKYQFVTGATKSVAAWRKRYMDNPLLSKLATAIIWSYSCCQKKDTFRVLDNQELVNANGVRWALPETGNISVAHPLNLTEGEISSWEKQLQDADIHQPIAQLSEPLIPFSSINDIKYRYSGIILPLNILRHFEPEGFKIYGSLEHGYELDNGIVRLHFDFGIKKRFEYSRRG